MAEYTFTTGQDTFPGTAGDDVFLVGGNIERIQSTDSFSGGAGTDTVRFLGLSVSFDANRMAGGSSIEVLDFEAATTSISVALVPGAVLQSSTGTLTLRYAGNAMLLDASTVGAAGTVVLHGTGQVTLRNFEGQAVSISDGAGGLVYGGTGADRIVGGAGSDTIYGGDGDDDLFAGGGSDAIYGGAGNDLLAGGGGNDSLYGEDGHDLIESGAGGGASLFGGAGSDTFRISAAAGTVTINDLDAADTMERIDLRGLSGIASFAALTISGPDGALNVSAAGLNLVLLGVAAADLTERSFIFAGDTVQAMAEGLVAGPVARFTAADDNFTGTSGNDVFELPGRLDSLTATDQVAGGAGTDTLRVLNNSVSLDASRLAGLSSVERIDLSSASTSLSVQLDAAAVTQAGGTLTLFHGANEMLLDVSGVGTAGRVVIEGTGQVTLRNFDGQRVTVADGYGATVLGGDNADDITGGGRSDTISGGLGGDWLRGGGGNDMIDGGEGNDYVAGGAGADQLSGGFGHDVIESGGGGDVLTGNDGHDTFRISAGAGQVRITDFAAADKMERIDLRALSGIAGFSALTLTNVAGGVRVTGSGLDLLLSGVSASQLSEGSFVFVGDPVQTVAEGLIIPANFRVSANDDTYTGSAQVDIIEVAGTIENLTAADTLNGGDGTDTLRFLNDSVSLDAARLTGLTSVERFDLASATTELSVRLDAATVTQAGGALTLFHGAADMMLDVSDVGAGRTVVVEGTGEVTLRNFEGQIVTVSNAYAGDVLGGTASDTITGGSRADRLSGGAGSDRLQGGGGNDALDGGDGNDIVAGGTGADTLNGGAGHDVVESGSGADVMTGGDGSDSFRISSGATQVRITDFNAADRMERIDLRALTGISNFAGLVVGNVAGGVRVTGPSLDLVLTGVSAAQLSDANFIFAGDTVQTMAEGLVIRPSFRTTAGTDTFSGTSQADVIEVPGSIESLSAADSLRGNGGLDTLRFLSDSVSLDGSRLRGINSIERFDLSSSTTELSVRLDAANVSQVPTSVLTLFHGGADMVLDVSEVGTAGTVVVEGTGTVTLRNLDGQKITVSDAYGGNVLGGGGADVINGGAKGDMLSGGAYTDTIDGGGGNDTISGGSENDVLRGGSGNDLIDGGEDDDQLYGDIGDDNLRGGLGNDRLEGGAGDDSVDGDEGNDTIILGPGQDWVEGGSGADTFVIGTDTGVTRIGDFEGGSLVERIDLRAFSTITGIGDLDLVDTSEGARLTIGATTVIIEGVPLADINPAQFIFAGSDPLTFNVAAGTAREQIQQLIDGAPAGASIIFGEGEFLVDQTLVVSRSDLTLRGQGSDKTVFIGTMTGDDAAPTFRFETTDVRQLRSVLAEDGVKGASQIVVEDASRIPAGTIIYFYQENDDAFLAETGNTGLQIPQEAIDRPDLYALREQIVEVVAVEGNVLTLAHPLNFNFDAGSTRVLQGDMLQNLDIGGFTVRSVLGVADPNLFEITLPEWANIASVDFDGIANSNISDIRVENAGSHAIQLQRAYQVTGDSLTAIGSHNKGGDGNGYGVYFHEAFYNTLTNVTVFDTRHAVLTSSWGAEFNNTVYVTDTNRDINFHGGPDAGNTVIVQRMVQTYGDSLVSWPAVGPGAFPLHPKSTVEDNYVRIGYWEGFTSEVAWDDTVYGLDSGSNLSGGGGEDRLIGGLGIDILNGQIGNDTLIGNAGDDILNGGARDDTMTGGTGRDQFVRSFGDGSDTITDFQVGSGGDVVVLRGYAVQSFGDLVLSQADADTVIDLGQDGTVLLQGVTASSLTPANFRFEASGQARAITASAALLVMGSDGDDTITIGRTSLTNGTAVLGGAGVDTLLMTVGNFTGNTADFGAFSSIERLDFRSATSVSLIIDDRIIDQSSSNRLTILVGDALTAAFDVGTPSSGLSVVFEGASQIQFASGRNQVAFGGDSVGVNFVGGRADDRLTGGARADRLDGGDGNDFLAGGGGNDTLIGGAGTDTAYFSGQRENYNIVQNGDGSMTITDLRANAPEGTDTLTGIENLRFEITTGIFGDEGDNTLDGTPQADQIFGLGGNDVIDGKAGGDTMAGGAGDDTYYVDNAGDVVTEDANAGTDTVISAISYSLPQNVENLTLGGSAANGTGNALVNTLVGNNAANRLDGGAGADTMRGGNGDDLYVVDNAGDVVVELADFGTDTVESSVTYTLAANVERLTLVGAAAINGTGNALDNVIIGTTGNNRIDGGAGADTLRGGKGNDTYVIDNAGDVIVEAKNYGTDTVETSISYTLGAELENLVLVGTASINGGGNGLANVLTGNSGDNLLDGKTGADRLAGGRGNDTYIVDNGQDVVTELADEGTDLVQARISYTLRDNVENLTLLGTSDINGGGNALANVIVGNSGNNRLNGLAGADAMRGGNGNDTYVVDNVGDTVVEVANFGTDTVEASVTYTLSANVENLVLTGTRHIDGTGNNLANVLTGNAGNNRFAGGGGNDTIDGGAGTDTAVFSGASRDYSVVNQSDGSVLVTDLRNGAPDGVDRLIGIENIVFLLTGDIIGDNGDNSLVGTNGDDVLRGLGGNDSLDGRSGADQMFGGAGDDSYIIDNTGDAVVELANEGYDTVYSGLAYYRLTANVESLVLTGLVDGMNGVGNELNNLIIGTGLSNILDGGAGADNLQGGRGDDTYVVDNAGDVVVEGVDRGNDTVASSISYTLPDNVETLQLSGTAENLRATGNALNNTLLGTGLNNVLDGGLGADEMQGGRGDDTYYVDNAGDRVVEGSNRGLDTVFSSVSYTLADNVENLNLSGTTDGLRGTGNGLANVINGTGLANYLLGEGGNDTLNGGRGNDTLAGGIGRDVLNGGRDADVFVFMAESDIDLVTDFENGTDRLVVTGHATGFAQLAFAAGDADGDGAADDVVVTHSGGSFAVLNVNTSIFDASDFVF